MQIAATGAVGDFHYLHITPGSGVIGSSWQNWFSVPGYYEGSRDLGTLAATQPTGCAFTGAHLHQSGDGGAGTQIWTHWTGGGSYYGTSNGETFYNWSAAEYDHYVQW